MLKRILEKRRAKILLARKNFVKKAMVLTLPRSFLLKLFDESAGGPPAIPKVIE
jgi:hypothetical protein